MSALFIILAAICNAVMDTLMHHYYKSIFKKYDPQFWNPYLSWKNKYVDWDGGDHRMKGFVQVSDAWHIFKTLMIVFICISVASFPMMPQICISDSQFLNYSIYIAIFGVAWNISFNIFYNKILKSEQDISKVSNEDEAV